jgi:hypothetical protein
MRKLPIPLAVVLFLFLTGCTPRDFLTRRLASDLIAGSETFNAPQKFWLRLGVTSSKDYSAPESLLLQRRGWITAAEAPCPPGVTPAPCWDVALTPLGVGAFRDLIPAGSEKSQFFSVPVARRQFLGITGISKDSTVAEVDFKWKWIPVNEIGQALYPGGVQYKSTVNFRHYDDGWRLTEGSAPKTNQGLEDALKNAEAEP